MLLYSYRGKREEKEGKKRGENGHRLSFYFLRVNPKSRLFQNVKEVPTNGIPKIRRCLKRIFLNSRNTELFLYRCRFMEFHIFLNSRNTELFLYRCRFMEFHLFRIFEYFANLLNSKNRHYFQIVRLLEFLFKLLIQARNDVWSVE